MHLSYHKQLPIILGMTLPAIFRHRFTPLALTGLALAALAAAGLGGYASWQANHHSPTVPASLAQQVLFPIYMPTSLPHGFTINPDSYQNSEGALLFYATNASADKIIFTEQIKPPDFNFADFYRKSLSNSRSVPGTPFTSIIGTSEDKTALMSIQADPTWLLITSKASHASDYFEYIAKRLKRQ